jgi:GGDEF domain-containing protein
MISEMFKKDIAVFIFNENIYLARAIKERLSNQSFDAHFYTDEALVRQAIYLALPHIVVLPSAQKYEKLIHDIRKMSREIQLIVIGPEEEYEGILSLKRKNYIDDYVLEPVTHLDSIEHRIQLASERWVLQNQLESIPKVPLATQTFIEKDLSEREPFQESILIEILDQNSEDEAMEYALEQLSKLTGQPYIFLSYDKIRDTLALKTLSFGKRKDLGDLGLHLGQLKSVEEFLKEPRQFKIFTDFISEVFNTENMEIFNLSTGEESFGFIVCLASLDSHAKSIGGRVSKILALKMDSHRKNHWIFNNIQIDKDYQCLANKHFYNKISDEISRARRIGLPLSIAVFEVSASSRTDIRHASTVLIKVLKRFTRVTDSIGKTSGQRFGLALIHCDLDNAVQKTRKLQSILKAALQENGLATVEVRAGVTSFPHQHLDAMSLLEAGEAACDLSAPFEVCLIAGDAPIEMKNKKINDVQL